MIKILKTEREKTGRTCPAQSVQHVTLDLSVMSSNPTLGVEPERKRRREGGREEEWKTKVSYIQGKPHKVILVSFSRNFASHKGAA